MEFSDFAPWIFAISVAVATQLIAFLLARRNLKAQQEHNLKVLNMQLYHEDRKKALIAFDELLKTSYKTFDDFKKAAMEFLDGKEALFLPRELRSELREEILELGGFLVNRLYELGVYEESPEEPPEVWEADSKAWAEAFPEDALNEEVRERLGRIKSTLRDKIKEHIEE